MNKNIYLFAMFCLVASNCFTACNGQNKSTSMANKAQTSQTTTEEKAFPFPSIPPMLTNPEERKAYLLEHYWDNFDFADTTLVNNREITEQGLVNQLALLADPSTTKKLSATSIQAFCQHLQKHPIARKKLLDLIDDYLYNPNSPLYNEGLYSLFLDNYLASEAFTDAEKSTFQFRSTLIAKNQPGTKALDFSYYLANGKRQTLWQTPTNASRTLLIFYDPECHSCHDVIDGMLKDPWLASVVKEGKLNVIAIYTEDNEAAWKESLSSLPQNWTIGTDRQLIKDKALYDLKAMPSLYLLDKDKVVVMKDAPYEKLKAVCMSAL